MGQPKQWSIEQHVREDAESVFVPAELLPDAQRGDTVELRSTHPAVIRRGEVVDRIADPERGSFVTVKLDSTTG